MNGYEIDFEQFCRGTAFPTSMRLGLYRVDEERLTLCLADSGISRTSRLTSGEHPHQSLGELARK
jgi:hypothetical protein